MSTHTRAYLEPSVRGGGQCNQFARPHRLGTPVDGPRPLWQLTRPCLENTGHGCYCINQVTVFQGQSGILGNVPSQPGATAASSYAPNLLCLLKGQLLGLLSGLCISFLIARGCHCFMSSAVEDSKDSLRLLQSNPKVPPYILTPKVYTHDHLLPPIPQVPIVGATGLIPSEQPNFQYKELTARFHA